MEKQQKFAIKKLSIGVCSACIGFAFMAGNTVQADEYTQPRVEQVIDVQTSIDEPIGVKSELTSKLNITEATSTEQPSEIEVIVETPVSNLNQEGLQDKSVNEDKKESVKEVLPVVATVSEKIEVPKISFRQAPSTSQPNALEALESNKYAFPDSKTIASMSNVEKDNFKTLLLTNFETKAEEVALKDIVKPHTGLNSTTTPYFTKIMTELREKATREGKVLTAGSPELKALIEEAKKSAITKANAELYKNDQLRAVAPAVKELFKDVLANNLLEKKSVLTVKQVKEDLPKLYRGILYLQQQYSFEEGLPKRLIFEPHKIGNIRNYGTTPYDHLKAYGTVTATEARNVKTALSLQMNSNQFKSRKIGIYTGTASPAELVERLASAKGKSASAYFEEQSQAMIGSVAGVTAFESLKAGAPQLILPLLSQGKGVYAATTQNSVSIGLLASYVDQEPSLKNWEKNRGEAQPKNPFFAPYLTYQGNFIKFLNDVKKKSIPYMVAIDTMNIYTEQGKQGWGSPSGQLANHGIANFFVPMNVYDTTYFNAKNFGGQSTGSGTMVAYEKRLMAKDLSGVTLFTHEMTHSNDEAALFGGTYQVAGRRDGQGPEVYARGLFEAIDNTQGISDFAPVFNLNTTLAIKEGPSRVQSTQPLTSKKDLETYTRHLMDLVAYLEGLEAEIALEKLTLTEKAIYFNRITQTDELNISQANSTRIKNNKVSTNDAFVPYGSLGVAPLGNPTTVTDLVRKDAVSGQFIPRGLSPILTNLTHNQYDSVPLLESFYGVQVASSGKNTVGDISFKRHAYEILAWKGWDAFITYVSNQSANDEQAFSTILQGETSKNWEDYKIEQYKRLLALSPVQQLWNVSELKTKLEAAIKADLQVLSAYRKDVDVALKTPATSKTMIDLAASKHKVYERATNVRAVKQEILNRALAYNNLMATVLEPKSTSPEVQSNTNNSGNPAEVGTLEADIAIEQQNIKKVPDDYLKYDKPAATIAEKALSFTEVIQQNDSRYTDSIVELEAGQNGREFTITVGNSESHRVIIAPVNRVVEVGTKPIKGSITKVNQEELDFSTETKLNPILPEGEERIIRQGEKGIVDITTVFETDHGLETGKILTTKRQEVKSPISKIIEIGTLKPVAADQVKTVVSPKTYRLSYYEKVNQDNYTLHLDYKRTLNEVQKIDSRTNQIISVESPITKENVAISSAYRILEIPNPDQTQFYRENENHYFIIVERNHSATLQNILEDLKKLPDDVRYELAKSSQVTKADGYLKELTQDELNQFKDGLIDERKFNEEMLRLINEERLAKKLQPLELHEELRAGVTLRAKEQAETGYFRSIDQDGDGIGDGKHVRPNGKNWGTAFLGLKKVTARGENMGQFATSDLRELVSEKYLAKKQFDLFKSSPEHYTNMMTSSFNVAYFSFAYSDDHKILMARADRPDQTSPLQTNGQGVIFAQVFGRKRSIALR